MSYCALIAFKDGLPSTYHEYHNAWGGAAYVWSSLYDLYCKTGEGDYWLRIPGLPWVGKLLERPDVPDFEKIVLLAMYDHAIVDASHFKRFARDLRLFAQKHGSVRVHGVIVNHLPAWADFFDTCTAEAVGFYPTSVGDDWWQVWDDEREESEPYSLRTGELHFELYDYFDEMAAAEAAEEKT